jgi:predicted aldo/keto reductase-like oxidoreductase
MEPVKGGSLVNLPSSAQKILDRLEGGSNASYAIRFAAGFEGVMMVLSGMSTTQQMEDNLSYMQDFQPLTEKEQEAVAKVCAIFRNKDLIPCTACRYCTEVCPQEIAIPELFAALNAKRQNQEVPAVSGGMPADCVKCGKCEESCPQNLKIRELLTVVAEEL